MTETFTVLVAGSLAEVGATQQDSRPSRSVAESMNALANVLASHGRGVRVLTGTDLGVEQLAADLADRQRMSLHILSAGQPASLTTAQAKAQRQVWLGAGSAELALREPHSVRDRIALGFCDALLVAWDGTRDDPRSMDLVLGAALAMKPVLWINAEADIRVLERERLTAARIHLLQCPTPSLSELIECFSVPVSWDTLTGCLQVNLALADTGPLPRGQDIRAERSRAGLAHRLLMALVQCHWRKAWTILKASPLRAYRGPAWDAKPAFLADAQDLDGSFDQADLAASVAAGNHRSAAWLSSLSSTAAVFAAVAGAINLWSRPDGAFWALLESALVALVLWILWRANLRQWHREWIGNRFVAEQLRYTRMGLPFLALPRSLLEPARCVEYSADGTHQLAVLSDDLANIQRTIACMGLPATANGAPYVAAAPEHVEALRHYVLSVVEDQIRYHHRVHHEHHAVDHTLHTVTHVLFGLTVGAIGAHFFLHAEWLLLFTAFFPALAAGIHGLTTSLEIARLAEQSKLTAGQLHELSEALKRIPAKDGSPWHAWMQMRHLTLRAAELMSDENRQWQKLVTHQKPRLPA